MSIRTARQAGAERRGFARAGAVEVRGETAKRNQRAGLAGVGGAPRKLVEPRGNATLRQKSLDFRYLASDSDVNLYKPPVQVILSNEEERMANPRFPGSS